MTVFKCFFHIAFKYSIKHITVGQKNQTSSSYSQKNSCFQALQAEADLSLDVSQISWDPRGLITVRDTESILSADMGQNFTLTVQRKCQPAAKNMPGFTGLPQLATTQLLLNYSMKSVVLHQENVFILTALYGFLTSAWHSTKLIDVSSKLVSLYLHRDVYATKAFDNTVVQTFMTKAYTLPHDVCLWASSTLYLVRTQTRMFAYWWYYSDATC